MAEGNVAAGEDTAVRFEHPGIGGVALDGEQAPAVDSGDGYVRVTVPAGSHAL